MDDVFVVLRFFVVRFAVVEAMEVVEFINIVGRGRWEILGRMVKVDGHQGLVEWIVDGETMKWDEVFDGFFELVKLLKETVV